MYKRALINQYQDHYLSELSSNQIGYQPYTLNKMKINGGCHENFKANWPVFFYCSYF